MRKSLLTLGAAILIAGTSGLALAQYSQPAPAQPYYAPSNPAPATTARTAAPVPANPTATTAEHPPSGSSTPPSTTEGPCPTGLVNYKGNCYPNQPSAFPK